MMWPLIWVIITDIFYSIYLFKISIFFFMKVFTYPSLSPVNAISGVISPTTLSLIASPVATPRSTPRSTPIPRWTTPFIPLDEGMGMDYNMLASFMHGVNSDEPLLNEGMIQIEKSFLSSFEYFSNCRNKGRWRPLWQWIFKNWCLTIFA